MAEFTFQPSGDMIELLRIIGHNENDNEND